MAALVGIRAMQECVLVLALVSAAFGSSAIIAFFVVVPVKFPCVGVPDWVFGGAGPASLETAWSCGIGLFAFG
jgi:hypothetical protein